MTVTAGPAGTGLTYDVEKLPEAMDVHSQASSQHAKRRKLSSLSDIYLADDDDEDDASVMSDV